jgi:hypothetical protein
MRLSSRARPLAITPHSLCIILKNRKSITFKAKPILQPLTGAGAQFLKMARYLRYRGRRRVYKFIPKNKKEKMK